MKFQEVTSYIVMPYLAGINNGEIIMNQKKWEDLPADLKAIVEECTTSAGIDFLKWSGYNDMLDVVKFQEENKGKLTHMDADTVSQMRKFSIEVVDEYSKKDPKYCAKAGELLKDLLKMNNRL